MFTIYEEALGQILCNKMVPGLGWGDLINCSVCIMDIQR